MSSDDKSLDLVGLGKLAEAIPDSVYEQTTETITTTFEKIIAPITETTSGLGRYIRQKFDNMVEVEQSLCLYAMQNAQNKIIDKQLSIGHISNPKAIIKIMEEVSKETDPLLNVLWTNLLCSELTEQQSHPSFINTLSSLSVKEALMLESLNSFNNIGDIKITVIIFPYEIRSWVKENKGSLNDWDFSCSLLCELGLTKTTTPLVNKEGKGVVILYRTDIGEEFLKAVSN